MSAPRATVVVCCHNGADALPRTLDALDAQTVRDHLEVVVVDDGSTDATARVADRAGVRIVRHPHNRGLAAARNTGWRTASAPIVAYTDDDCRPRPEWLATLLPVLEGGAVPPGADGWVPAGAGGSVVGSRHDTVLLRYLRRNNPLAPLEADLLADDRLPARLWLYLKRSGAADRPAGTRPVSALVGANMAFRVSQLERHGGFDERFRFGGEEEDLCRRIVTGGTGTLVFVPAAGVEHDFEPSLADTLRRSAAYGIGNARMFLKHPQVRPTLYPLPVALAGALVAAAVLGRPRLAATAIALPHLLFSRWAREAARTRNPEPLLYPYLAALQETWSNAGFVRGWLTQRRAFAAEPAEPAGRTPAVPGSAGPALVGREDGP